MSLLHHLQTKSVIPKFSSCSIIHLHMRVLETPVTTYPQTLFKMRFTRSGKIKFKPNRWELSRMAHKWAFRCCHNKTVGKGSGYQERLESWQVWYQGQSFICSFCWQESGERKENFPKVVPSACVIHLPKEAEVPGLSLRIFRIRGDKVLGDVLQKTFAGSPHGTISESSSCHIWEFSGVLLSGQAGPALTYRTLPFPNFFVHPQRQSGYLSSGLRSVPRADLREDWGCFPRKAKADRGIWVMFCWMTRAWIEKQPLTMLQG